MKPGFEKPSEKEIEELYLKHPLINIKTADGAEEFVELFLNAFEHRYTDEELDVGLQDQHIHEAWQWYERTIINKTTIQPEQQQINDHLERVKKIKALKKARN